MQTRGTTEQAHGREEEGAAPGRTGRSGADRRLFSVHEYHRMSEAGVLGEDDRVELIGGEVIAVAAIGSRHFNCVNRLNRLLVRAVADDVIVSPQNPVRLDERNEPEPDFALLKERDYSGSLPAPEDILLLVEVSDTTLAYDREVKLPLYARFGVPEVWIVDLAGGFVERHTEPSSGGYKLVRRFGKGDGVESSTLTGLSFAADEVLG